jgi:hypothetical protein
MILHLILDDKFTDYAINQFLEIEDSSHFVLLVDADTYNVNFIERKKEIQLINIQSPIYKQFCSTINEYQAVILHGLFSPLQVNIIQFLDDDTKLAWVFWGGEIYGRNDIKLDFLSRKSKYIYYYRYLKRLLKGNFRKDDHFFAPKSIFNRIDYCLTDVHEDYEYIKKYTDSPMKELWYNYYSIEETIGELVNQNVNDNNILVGNSCNLENNHIDAFQKLRQFNLPNKKVIVPLSYGQNWLRKIILKNGFKYLGSSFIPLTDFVKLNEYNQIILSCSVVVMNHYRPQAMGNLLTAFWLGARVYMSNKSHLYNYFKRLGVLVYSIEDDLNVMNKMSLTPLTESEVEHNRSILRREYGKENMMKKIKELVQILNS